ncbi:hypothetical protein AB835_08535 [Candidatus Endobugula sertula]|uniref:Uncharacterized protein n=1 Tax=Candidatus Endobugula sertula TaxID=62101 RepID=A0A1D2QPG4_9GAMM|nr:hypothetical protein AB835_08535 [Candidatus Endobugula sertula]
MLRKKKRSCLIVGGDHLQWNTHMSFQRSIWHRNYTISISQNVQVEWITIEVLDVKFNKILVRDGIL